MMTTETVVLFCFSIFVYRCSGYLRTLPKSSVSYSSNSGPPESFELNELYSFDNYIFHFNKPYQRGSDEWKLRESLFAANLEIILDHNRLFYSKSSSSDKPSYAMGVNAFTDMQIEEVATGYDKSYHPTYRKDSNRDVTYHNEWGDLPFTVSKIEDLPSEVDWRESGVVSPVKNQGSCGSCWAFAATEVLESHVAIVTGTPVKELAPQQLVSCVQNPMECGGEGGCSGATPEIAYEYLQEAGGMLTEQDFPYKMKNGVCEGLDLASSAVVAIEGYANIPTNNYLILLNAVAKYGPVAVAVDASHWMFYEHGVFNMESSNLNHAVVVVGYGTDEEFGDYWLVRNSWGSTYGENGYIRVARSDDGKCIMDEKPLDGLACKFDADGNPLTPQPIEVCGMDGILFDGVIPIGGHLLNTNSSLKHLSMSLS